MTSEELHDLWQRLTEWMRSIDPRSEKWFKIYEARDLVEKELWPEKPRE